MVIQKYKLSSFGDTKSLIALDDRLIDELLFTEKLYVFDENGKRIGRFSLKLDQDETVKQNKTIFGHISNRAFINGRLSESIVTGTVTTKMKTLEEIRYECSEMSNMSKQERCTFILREATKYYVSVTNTICDTKHQTHYTLPFAECLGMIGECSNALLLRRLAIKGYEGILQLKTILSNGKRCKNYYVTKLSEQTVNGKRMQVLIVYRNITNFKKLNTTMTMALTRAGQLIYLFWSNSKCFLHVDPDCPINTRLFTFADSPLELHWHKDVQLHSMYLDKMVSAAFKFYVKLLSSPKSKYGPVTFNYRIVIHHDKISSSSFCTRGGCLRNFRKHSFNQSSCGGHLARHCNIALNVLCSTDRSAEFLICLQNAQALFYRFNKYDNEPLRRILGDFLQYVLLKKPKNVVCFAIEYFSAFGHSTMTKCPSDFKMPTDEFDFYYDKTELEENYWSGEEFYFFQSP